MAAPTRTRNRRRLTLEELPLRPSPTYRHRRSLSDSVATNSTNSARILQRQILANAKDHLRDYSIVRHITAERFAPFLPQESDSIETVALFHRWMTAPLLVTDGELQQILQFQAAGQAPLKSRQSCCYFRSWPMEKWHLERIMQSIRGDGYLYSAFSNWNFIIRDVANNAIVTPRYVGSTSREDSRKRGTHQTARGNTTFVEKFDAKLSELFPALSSKGIIYLIKDSTLFYAGARLAAQSDLHEGWMISFFGPSSLLNRQRGGINPSFIPFHEDVCTFLKCRTTLLAKVARIHLCKGDRLIKEVRSLYRPLEGFIYAIIRQTRPHYDIDSYMDRISQQATPIQVCQYTMLVFCGLQTTKTSVDEGKGFFDGSTMFAQFSRTMLEILASSEYQAFQNRFEDIRSILSFNNIYHWTGNEIKNGTTSIDLFYKWLWIVKPLIIVTLGKDVVGVINKKASNARIDNLMRAVGRGQVINEGLPEETILIPLLHPGFDRRSQQSPLQRRVFLLSYIAVWVYIDIVLEIVQNGRSNLWSRRKLCQSIKEAAETKLQEANFYDALNYASEQLLVETAKAHPISHPIFDKAADKPGSRIFPKTLRPFKPGEMDVLDEVEAHFSDCALHMKILFDGIADGLRIAQDEPHSRERQRQIKSLYSQKIPSLITYLNSTDQGKWTDFMVRQPKDCSLVACVEALEPLARMPPQKVKLLKLYRCNDTGDFESRRTVLFSICTDFFDRQTEWIKWMKSRGSEMILLYMEPGQTRDIPVHVSLSGVLIIRGEVCGILKAARIKHKAIATKTWLDKRTVDFNVEQIIIRDENRNPLHIVRRFLCDSEDLRILWGYILGSNNPVASTSSATATSVNQIQQQEPHNTGSSVGAYSMSAQAKSGQKQKPGKPPLKQNQKGSS